MPREPVDTSHADVAWMSARNADAQQPIRGQSVLDRERPDYAPIGARLGAFIFNPYVGASQLFDDNIFFTPNDPVSDFISTATAGLRARLRSVVSPDARNNRARCTAPSILAKRRQRSSAP